MREYTIRLYWIGACLVGGFTILCVSGWFLVIDGSAYDSTLVTALRWLPVLTGAFLVFFGFYLIRKPIPESPEEFFYDPDPGDQ